MAEILWAEGWSMHVEEHGCERLAGMDITEVMPPIPKDARDIAEKWAKEIELRNKKKLEELYQEAMEANEREGKEESRRSSETTFGNNLAFMVEGSGASWFDYNAEFDLDVPDHSAGGETSDLMYLAGSKCKAAWENPACTECGAFNRSDDEKCRNCGEPLEEPEED
jgi:hypothetical protein